MARPELLGLPALPLFTATRFHALPVLNLFFRIAA